MAIDPSLKIDNLFSFFIELDVLFFFSCQGDFVVGSHLYGDFPDMIFQDKNGNRNIDDISRCEQTGKGNRYHEGFIYRTVDTGCSILSIGSCDDHRPYFADIFRHFEGVFLSSSGFQTERTVE